MRYCYKCLQIGLFTVTIMLLCVFGGSVFKVQAADYYNGAQDASGMPSTWEQLKIATIDGESYYVKLNSAEGANAYRGTFNADLATGRITGKDEKYSYRADDSGLLISKDSRMVFDTKIEVGAGTVLSVVGATADGPTHGGKDVNDGYSFYWTVMEFDSDGYAIYDGDWRDTTQTWKVGYEKNELEGDEVSRAPGYKGAGGDVWRAEDVAYVMIIVRIASGDKTQGANNDLTMSRQLLYDKFPNMYVVGQPFTYNYYSNEGTFQDGNDSMTLQRMGITPYVYNESVGGVTSEIIKMPSVLRKGYDFLGWKVISQSGKGLQDGNVYMPDGSFVYDKDGGAYSGEGDILSNGLFYSSLFDIKGSSSFFAQWKPTEYNIIYNLDGGEISVNNPACYNIETPTFILNNPIKQGYRFIGWTGSNGTVPESIATINSGTTGDLSFTANWEADEVTVTVKHYVMDVNGVFPKTPTRSNSLKLTVGKSYMDDYGAEYFKDESLEKAGQIMFSGYEFPSIGIVSGVANDNVVKMYYSRRVYTVTFNVAYNNGWWEDDNEDMKVAFRYGSVVDAGRYKAMKADMNWEFIGWNVNADGKCGIESYIVEGNVTLYAQFKCNIAVGFTDAKGREEINVTIYNRETSKEINIPYLDEYETWDDVTGNIALGWTTADDVTAKNGITAELEPGGTLNVTASDEYYGVYRGFALVSYDENGGKPFDYTEDQIVRVHKNSANLSKIRGGSVTMPDCESYEVDNANGSITTYTLSGWSDGGELYSVGSSVGVSKNVKFVAQWNSATRDITYTIVFDMNGGKNGPPPRTVRYGEGMIIPGKGSKTGFKLMGWCTSSDGSGTNYHIGDTLKNLTDIDGATVTLYAQWKQRPFVLVKISSSRYGATFAKRTQGDEEWFAKKGRITVNEWNGMTEEEKNCISIQKWKISIDDEVSRVE